MEATKPKSPLIERLESLGDAPALADAGGVDKSTAYRWLQGERRPQSKAFRALAQHFGVREEWLITGKGQREGRADARELYAREGLASYVENGPAALVITFRMGDQVSTHTLRWSADPPVTLDMSMDAKTESGRSR